MQMQDGYVPLISAPPGDCCRLSSNIALFCYIELNLEPLEIFGGVGIWTYSSGRYGYVKILVRGSLLRWSESHWYDL
jgi:hypothetical protein